MISLCLILIRFGSFFFSWCRNHFGFLFSGSASTFALWHRSLLVSGAHLISGKDRGSLGSLLLDSWLFLKLSGLYDQTPLGSSFLRVLHRDQISLWLCFLEHRDVHSRLVLKFKPELTILISSLLCFHIEKFIISFYLVLYF